jgi:eight-cysteine-cluster-containing protein
VILLLALFACSGPHPPEGAAPAPVTDGAGTPTSAPVAGSPAQGDAVPTSAPADGTAPDPNAPVADPNAPVPTPAEVYASCRARVEGEETPGECATDADCSPAGCSQEVCGPARSAGSVTTTCEILPCFSVLDTCGCHAGVCTWTIKAGGPPLRRRPGADPQ